MSNTSLKKVLIVTYYWPPSGGSGVQRWLKFVKYMREFGWEPVVYTPSNPERPAIDMSLSNDIPEGTEVITQPVWEPYSFYKKFVGLNKDEKLGAAMMKSGKERSFFHDISVWIRGNFFIPDARKFWIRPSVKYLRKYLAENPVDVIITSGPPHSMHMIGKGLTEKTGIPWLADFRDPWTNIDFFQDLKLIKQARKKHHRLEKEVLDRADKIVVISETMKTEFQEITETDIKVITNGFDHEDFEEAVYERSEFCTLSHIGMMTPTRNPEILWKALSELKAEVDSFDKNFRLQLIGKVDDSIKKDIRINDLEDIVTFNDYIPHTEVIKLQKRSDALLLIINDSPNAALLLTGKIFEYLAAKRPILCITPIEGDASRLLESTSPSAVSVLYSEQNRLKEEILRVYEAWSDKKDLYVESDADRFSRRNLTKEMTKELDSLI